MPNFELPLKKVEKLLRPYRDGASELERQHRNHPEQAIVSERIAGDLVGRLRAFLDLGLGYLALDRSTPTFRRVSYNACVWQLSFTRICLASFMFSTNHLPDCIPQTPRPSVARSDSLKGAGNTFFVVEHEPEVMRHADWLVDVGPGPANTAARFSTAVSRRAATLASLRRPNIFSRQKVSLPQSYEHLRLAQVKGSQTE